MGIAERIDKFLVSIVGDCDNSDFLALVMSFDMPMSGTSKSAVIVAIWTLEWMRNLTFVAQVLIQALFISIRAFTTYRWTFVFNQSVRLPDFHFITHLKIHFHFNKSFSIFQSKFYKEAVDNNYQMLNGATIVNIALVSSRSYCISFRLTRLNWYWSRIIEKRLLHKVLVFYRFNEYSCWVFDW